MALYTGFQKAVATLCADGADVILDDVTLDGVADQQRWNDALKGLQQFWIGVRCDPEIAAEREARRQSRLPGTARHQASAVHSGVRYDLEVDTGRLDLAQALGVIAAFLSRNWGLEFSPRADQQSAPPPVSAWVPGEPLRPPPWEE